MGAAPDLHGISVYAEAFDLESDHFLVRDEEPRATVGRDTLTVAAR